MEPYVGDRFNLPWRNAYDFFLSKTILVFLLIISTAIWVAEHRKGRELLRGLGMGLLFAYIVAVSIVFERGENQRFKFFLEPVMLMFIISQLATALLRLHDKYLHWKKRTKGMPTAPSSAIGA